MATSREAQLHADWLGMLKPDGLVVSIPVLDEAMAYVRQPVSVQADLRERLHDERLPGLDALLDHLAWPRPFLRDDPEHTRLDLPDLGATVEADHVLTSPQGEPLLLVSWLDGDPDVATDPVWPTSPQERLERLLVGKKLPVGVLVTPTLVRLTYAPGGEAPGRLAFPISALCATDGRLLVDALHMLLGRARLYTVPAEHRLLPLLRASRQRQDAVTVKLAGQVEDALRILLEGFDTADARSSGALLRGVPPEELYGGLTTTLLRLVFLLYAEDKGLMPVDHPIYSEHYSVAALAERLQADRVSFAGAMDRRFGAWARLLALFRIVFTGAQHHGLQLPARQGDLFDPGRYPFLEGRVTSNWRQGRGDVPRVDDAVVDAILHRLLHVEGQRLSFQNLEVEQIGSVYESLMGFDVARAGGRCLPLKPDGVVVELHDLREASDPVQALAQATGERASKVKKALPALADFAPTDDVGADLAALEEALQPRVPKRRGRIEPGRHYLQPGEERRRSGSHYTPRSLTEPIVERTLSPLLDAKGPPSPEAILALRVCDPAMGSGAFLAEACRYLARRLVEAWGRTGTMPPQALQLHDPELYARRLVAESCLYGVDKNPRAVQLARLSLWLVTSARDLPFTFVDHALKEGDALIGLDLDQVAAFSFAPDASAQTSLWFGYLRGSMASAARTRAQITARQRELMFGHDQKKTILGMADDEVWDERRIADLLVACGWEGGRKKQLRDRIARMGDMARVWYPNEEREPLPEEAQEKVDGLPFRPFHWWLEFPEVFAGKQPGFDAVVGNPPFGGKNTISATSGDAYIPLLQQLWPHAHGASDLAAYFFLRAAALLRKGGTFGLVATNTIAQGNTRDTGLKHLVEGDLELYDATVDMPWPVAGAAVVVSVVHGANGRFAGERRIDGEPVSGVRSDLKAGEELPDPVKLKANANQAFQGSNVLGRGFVLTLDEAAELIERDPRHAEIVKPYIGGRELNNNVPPTPDAYVPHERCVIDFGDRNLEEAEAWPELLAIVREKVKPERDQLKDNPDGRRRKKYWWHFGRRVPGLDAAIEPLDRCLVCARVSKHLSFSFQPSNRVFSEKLVVFPQPETARFAVLQSRCHNDWAWAFSTTMKTDLSYSPSVCLETFPFPRPTPAQENALTATGQALFDARQRVMVARQLGMTQVWNLVVDEDCLDPDIVELRALRDAMDRAVLDAYGWSDLDPTDTEAILTRLRKLNAKRAAEERRKG